MNVASLVRNLNSWIHSNVTDARDSNGYSIRLYSGHGIKTNVPLRKIVIFRDSFLLRKI